MLLPGAQRRSSRCARIATRAQAPLQPGPSPDFFDREFEREQLQAWLGDSPTSILVRPEMEP